MGWTIAALSVGTALNPLNSSMVAVALVALQQDFEIGVVEVTWVITVFYIASIVGNPLMGRVIDAFGARRTFLAGMVVVGVAGAVAPLGGYGLVLVARAAMAIGSSVAFPAAIALLAPLAEMGRTTPPRLLARIQITNTTAASLGPVVGGLLIALGGWPAIFFVNVPLTLAALVSVAVLAPKDVVRTTVTPAAVLRVLDPAGVLAFGIGTVALLLVVLGAGGEGTWVVIGIGVVALAGFVVRELRARVPFIDVRLIAANPALVWTYAAFTAFCVLYYLALFGLPQLLEEHGGYSTAVVGLLILPLSAMMIILAPWVARTIERRGLAPVLVATAVLLLLSAAALGVGAVSTAPVPILLLTAVMGVPYCMGSLVMTEAARRVAPPDGVGVASGLLQSMRYLGAIAATVVLGRTLSGGVDAAAWVVVTLVAGGAAVVHLVVALLAASALRRQA